MTRISLISELICLVLIFTIIGCEGDNITVDTQTIQGIQVVGSGSVSGVPDVAILSLGITAEESDVGEARASAADSMEKMIDSFSQGPWLGRPSQRVGTCPRNSPVQRWSRYSKITTRTWMRKWKSSCTAMQRETQRSRIRARFLMSRDFKSIRKTERRC